MADTLADGVVARSAKWHSYSGKWSFAKPQPKIDWEIVRAHGYPEEAASGLGSGSISMLRM